MNFFIYPALLIAMFSCTNKPQQKKVDTTLSPKKDSLNYVVNTDGDSILTGIPVISEGKKMKIDSANTSTFSYIKDKSISTPIIRTVQLKSNDVRSFSFSPTITTLGKDSIPFSKDTIFKGTFIPLVTPNYKKINNYSQNKKSNFNIKHLGVKEGLSSPKILTIYQDKRSNIWIGTAGGGIMKYDGENIQQYTLKNGAPGIDSRAIIEDSKGNMWFGSYGNGISMFDGHELTNYNTSNGLNHDFVFAIKEDKDNNIWVSSQQGVNKISITDGKTTISSFSVENGLSSPYILSIEADHNGNLWFGTYGKGVCKFDGTSFRYLTTKNGLVNDIVYSIYEDTNHNIWIGTEGGISKIEGEKITNYTTNQGLPANPIRDIKESAGNIMWFANYGGGVIKLKENRMTFFNERNGLANNKTNTVLPINESTFFVGFSDNGIDLINTNSFYMQSNANGFPSSKIYPITKGNTGELIFADKNNQIYRKQNDTLITIPINSHDYSFQAIAEDKDNNIWIADHNLGLIQVKKDSMRIYTTADGLPHFNLSNLYIDSKGLIWVSTYGAGLCSFDGKEFTSYRKNLSYNTITSYLEDKKGNLWLGVVGWGVVKFNGKEFTHFTEHEGLIGHFTWSAIEDKQHNLWFSTETDGINIFNGKGFKQITTENGLIDNKVESLIQDKDGNVWAGTSKGISKITLEKENKFSFKSYNTEDGNSIINFMPYGAIIDKHNTCWWATNKGLLKLEQQKKYFDNIPNLFLNEIAINNKFIDFHQKDSLNNQDDYSNGVIFFNYPKSLTLPYKKNSVKFYFSASNYSKQHKVLYSYKVDGYIEEWSTPSRSTELNLQKIPYGNYIFKVKAKSESNKWCKPIEYAFIISPPYYYTWWAKIIYVLFTIFILFILVQWRTFKLKKRQKKLENDINLATNEIKSQKIEVEQQKEVIEETHKEITDSINYAKRLQDAILPSINDIDKYIPENFILFKPKDVVSGDFYWMETIKANKTKENFNTILIASADCTGHGVPGALVSIVCSNALNRTVNEFNIIEPAEILNKTRDLVIETFAKSGEEVKDGMDIALCSISNNSVTFSGANNPLWIVRKTELITEEQKQARSTFIDNEYSLIEYKANKQPIGLYEGMKPFTQKEIKVYKGDVLYFFTDGYADQFGGVKGKKFKYKPFKKLLLKHHYKSMPEQKKYINNAFEEWKGDLEQIDDVCIIAIKI